MQLASDVIISLAFDAKGPGRDYTEAALESHQCEVSDVVLTEVCQMISRVYFKQDDKDSKEHKAARAYKQTARLVLNVLKDNGVVASDLALAALTEMSNSGMNFESNYLKMCSILEDDTVATTDSDLREALGEDSRFNYDTGWSRIGADGHSVSGPPLYA